MHPQNVDASLRRAAGLYRGLVEKLPGVTYLWGPAGRCTYVSPQVVEVFGRSEQAFGEVRGATRSPRKTWRGDRPRPKPARRRPWSARRVPHPPPHDRRAALADRADDPGHGPGRAAGWWERCCARRHPLPGRPAGRRRGFQATVEGEFGRLPGEFESLAYRIVREAVINANKHAQCRRLDVHLHTADSYLEGTISDDGIGFSPEQALSRGDAGLHSALERARIVDGTLAIISAPGRGTTVRLRLPIAEIGD